MKIRFLVLGVLILCTVSSAFAQGVQTATLEGTVTGPDGAALPGVMVTVKSPALMGERQAVTSPTGEYVIRGLPPGEYTVLFTLEGMRKVTQKLTLLLGSTSRADAALKVSAIAEAITVTAASPTVLENTSVGANLKSESMNQLPVVRTPIGIASLSPGVTGDRGGRDGTPVAGQLSISGGMAYDNALLINGVNFADNIFAQANNLFIEDAIQETQVLSSGISAEYGHFTGGVINVITKSGGNQFSGSFRADLTNPKWLALTPYEEGFRGAGVTPVAGVKHADKLSKVYEVTLGGPILRDRIWFFIAGRDEKSATPNNFPVTGYSYTVNQTNRRPEYKLTGNIASNHTLQVDYIDNPVKRDNEVQVAPLDPTAVGHNSTRQNKGYTVNWQGVLTTSLFGEARYSKKSFGFRGLGGTSTNIVDSPFRSSTRFPGNTVAGTFNAPYFDATDPENRDNNQTFAALSYFISTPRIGTHDVKGGWEQFNDIRTGGNSQTASGFVFSGGYQVANGLPVLDANGNLVPTFSPRSAGSSKETRVTMWIPTRGAELTTKTSTFFINDRWSLNSFWSFNLGIRHEVVKSSTSGTSTTIVPIDTTNTVPRLAASYDPKGNGRFKFDVTYAQYAGRYNPGLIGANTPVGTPASVTGYYTGPAGAGRDFAPGFDMNNYVFYTASVPTGNVFVQNGMHSPVNHEWTFSAGGQLPNNGWVKGTFTDRKYKDFIDDFVTLDHGCTNILIQGVNLGCVDNIFYANTNGPKRHYQAVELQSRYNITRAWSVEGNLTHQLKNDGNFEGEAGQNVGPNSAYGNRPEMQSPRENPVGKLSQYQANRLRLWTSYNLDFHKFGNLSAGLIYRYDSPLSFSYSQSVTRSQISKSANPGYHNASSSVTLFWGDRGVGRFAAASLFDVSLQYSLPIAGKVTPWVKLDVRNVFNSDKQIGWDTTVNPDTSSPLDSWGYPTAYVKAASFGRPTSTNSYVRPREYLTYVGIRF